MREKFSDPEWLDMQVLVFWVLGFWGFGVLGPTSPRWLSYAVMITGGYLVLVEGYE